MLAVESGVARRQAGFTLIEMLAVMTIIALGAGAFAFYARSNSGSTEVRTSAARIAALMRSIRIAAINQQRERLVLIDTAQGIISTETARQLLTVRTGIALAVISAISERRSQKIAAIRFFPNGSSTGATIRLTRERQVYEVRINWLTGRVSQAALP